MWNGRATEPHHNLPYLAISNAAISISDIRLVLDGGDIPPHVIDLVGDLLNAGGTSTQVVPTAVATTLYREGRAEGPPWDWEALLLPFRDPMSGR